MRYSTRTLRRWLVKELKREWKWNRRIDKYQVDTFYYRDHLSRAHKKASAAADNYRVIREELQRRGDYLI